MKKSKIRYRFKTVVSRLDWISLFIVFISAVFAWGILASNRRVLPTHTDFTEMNVLSVRNTSFGRFSVLFSVEPNGERVVCYASAYSLPFEEGDRVLGECQFSMLSEDVVYEKALIAKGITSKAECSSFERLGKMAGIQKYRYEIRTWVKKLVSSHINPPLSSLLLGMLSGDDSDMPKSFGTTMRTVGLTHIVVVSGYNISVVIEMAKSALKFLGRKLATVVGLLLVGVFVWIVGPEPPVIRAVAMAATAAIATALGRKVTMFRALMLSSAGMLGSNPLWLNSVSFHLSFLATLAIGWSRLLVPKWLDEVPLVGNFAKEFFLQTVTVLMFTVPYTMHVFGEFTWIAILSNLLVLPVCKLIMSSGAIAICSAVVSEALGKAVFAFAWVVLWYVCFVSDRLAGFARPVKFSLSTAGLVCVYLLIALVLIGLNIARSEK